MKCLGKLIRPLLMQSSILNFSYEVIVCEFWVSLFISNDTGDKSLCFISSKQQEDGTPIRIGICESQPCAAL